MEKEKPGVKKKLARRCPFRIMRRVEDFAFE